MKGENIGGLRVEKSGKENYKYNVSEGKGVGKRREKTVMAPGGQNEVRRCKREGREAGGG